jgi:hypothetical protein
MNIRKFPLRPAVRFLRYAFLVVVVVFWIRSHCVFDRLGWARNTVSGKSRVDHLLQFNLCNGRINFQMLTVKIPDVDAFYASAHIDGGENTAGSKFEWERLPKRLFDVRSTFMPGDREMRWSRAGFFFHQWSNDVGVGSSADTDRMFPCWLFLLILLLDLPRVTVAVRRRRRRSAGRCITCGYDLRSSPVSCPECGSRQVKSESSTKPRDKLINH